MSQTASIQALQTETDRLRSQVEALQRCLARQGEIEPEQDSIEEDVWNVWPYSWAQNGWSRAAIFFNDSLHSFHENREFRRLTRENRQARANIESVTNACPGLRLL